MVDPHNNTSRAFNTPDGWNLLINPGPLLLLNEIIKGEGVVRLIKALLFPNFLFPCGMKKKLLERKLRPNVH